MLLPWAPSARDKDRKIMLSRIGVKDPMELYRDIPQQLILPKPPHVGFGRQLSEWEIRRLFNSIISKNRVFLDPPPFLGGGVCFHVVPAAVKAIISRAEFYTAYTPYQPEINQGLLQAFFEYQSMIADLYDMDVVNASMYDWSTAAAEAALMALRVLRERRRIVVAGTVHPERLQTIRTWLYGKNVEVKVAGVDGETGKVRVDDVERLVNGETAAVYVETPNFYGVIEDEVEAIVDYAHKKGALAIVGSDPLSLGLIKPPGSYGADIAVGDGQPLGLGLNYGGPYLGIFAVKWDRKLVRQLPGRLIGLTRTVDGSEHGFVMILQAREQHIRREKATSNITTNEALTTIAAAAYLALLGGEGLRKLARSIWLRSHYAAKRLSEVDGVTSPAFSSEFFKEFTVRFPKPYSHVYRKLLEKGIMGGLDLHRYGFSRDPHLALFCVTEAHSPSDIDKLVEAVEHAVKA
jgi:glycine dehydrogenase subunit 1